MLPAGIELRPDLQWNDKTLAVGFPGEDVPDPFATGELAKALPGVVAEALPEGRSRTLVIDLRNVEEITAPGIYAIKSMRHAMKDQGFHALLVVRSEKDRSFLAGCGVTDHMPIVVGEEGVRAWIVQCAEDEMMFTPANMAKMIAESVGFDEIMAAIDRKRG